MERNCEFLAVILALQILRHWLERAEQQFLVWTDHKNLSYLHSIRSLNSRQACWALFRGRFRFSLSYRPGSHNIKLDALSRFSAPDTETTQELATILSPDCFASVAQWKVEKLITEAQRDNSDPALVPLDSFLFQLLSIPKLGSFKLICHLSIHRTLSSLKERFWWPTMSQDSRAFVSTCSICARSKTTHQALSGLLHLLFIPHGPWSHIAVRPRLPPSQCNIVILTIVNCFS